MTEIMTDTSPSSTAINALTQFDFDTFTQQTLNILHTDIQTLLRSVKLPTPLDDASEYVMLAGGKRVRPLLVACTYHMVMQTGKYHEKDYPENHRVQASYHTSVTGMHKPDRYYLNETCRRSMLSVELLHAYSLVHDDLPCMDDDALRRGNPTCHIKFDEAAALLTGDVLQTLAFETLTPELNNFQTISALQSAHLLSAFSPRARRMVMGQMRDLNAENKAISQPDLEAIHKDKTGALIEAAVLMGGISAGATEEQLTALRQFAIDIGLAFQVQDDILDVTKSTDDLGKPAGSDEKLDKSTYVKLMGVEMAKQYAKSLFDSGTDIIKQTFSHNHPLIELSDWLWHRHH